MALTVSCPGDLVGTWSAASAPQCFELRRAESTGFIGPVERAATQHSALSTDGDSAKMHRQRTNSCGAASTASLQPFNSHSTANEVKAQQDPLTMGETPETI